MICIHHWPCSSHCSTLSGQVPVGHYFQFFHTQAWNINAYLVKMLLMGLPELKPALPDCQPNTQANQCSCICPGSRLSADRDGGLGAAACVRTGRVCRAQDFLEVCVSHSEG